MKNFTKLFGSIALAAVIMFAMSGCGGGDESESVYLTLLINNQYSAPITQWAMYSGGSTTYPQFSGTMPIAAGTTKKVESSGPLAQSQYTSDYTIRLYASGLPGGYVEIANINAAHGKATNLTLTASGVINPFTGTSWTGKDWQKEKMILSFTDSAWRVSWPNKSYADDTGTYTFSGNVATHIRGLVTAGTSTIVGNILTHDDTDNSATYTLTRK